MIRIITDVSGPARGDHYALLSSFFPVGIRGAIIRPKTGRNVAISFAYFLYYDRLCTNFHDLIEDRKNRTAAIFIIKDLPRVEIVCIHTLNGFRIKFI